MDLDTGLQAELGVYRSPGLAAAWPELRTQLAAIFADRVQVLPWVPADWSQRVNAVMAMGDVVRLLPLKVNGSPNLPLPDWLTVSAARLDIWDQIAKATNQAVASYAAGQAEAGRATLAAAYANAAFWDRLYRIDVAIAQLPQTAAKAIGSGVLSALKLNWLVVAVVVGGALVYLNRGTLARSVGKVVARG